MDYLREEENLESQKMVKIFYTHETKTTENSCSARSIKSIIMERVLQKIKRDLPENLWLEIKDLTGVSSAEAQSVEKEVRRWF